MCTSLPRSMSAAACWAPSRSQRRRRVIAQLVEWLASLGEVVLVGVEGTGSYGAGLTRHLQGLGIAVVEVDRPNRQRRRRAGKSDTHDAISAARARSRATRSAHPRPATATSKRSGCCDWLATAPNETGPGR